MSTLFVVGVGLIGGSVARGVRDTGAFTQVLGWDADPRVLQAALELGVIDAAATNVASGALAARLTVLATPVGVLPCLLQQLRTVAAELALGGHWVTDVGSVKASLIAAATREFGEMPGWLVPGHPLAGSERSGLSASRGDLFRGRKVLLCPAAQTQREALNAVTSLWRGLGAQIETMDAGEHDHMLAMTSHLPHLLAFALVDALLDLAPAHELYRYAAGGFQDFTRIASSDPVMWRDISLDNAEPLLAALDTTMARLTQLRGAIAARDGAALLAAFTRAKQARDGEL